MPKFDVHLFSVVRFTVRGIQAESMEEACKKADGVLSGEAIKEAMCGSSEHEADFDDEVIEALVDVQGDEDYSESIWFKPAGEAWVKKPMNEKHLEGSSSTGGHKMIDINEAPNKAAATLEKFLEDCENEDPYIQNIYMAARYLVTAGLGHCVYQTQYESGTTLWIDPYSHHSIPRIPYQRKTKIVVIIQKGLVDSVISDMHINAEILVEDHDGDKTEFQELEIEVNPEKVAGSYAEAEKSWEEDEKA